MFWWALCFESWIVHGWEAHMTWGLKHYLENYHVLMGVMFWSLKLIMFWWLLCFASWNLSCFDECYVSNLETSHVLIIIIFRVSFAHTLSCLEQVSQSLQILTISRIYNLREKLQNWCTLWETLVPREDSPLAYFKEEVRFQKREIKDYSMSYFGLLGAKFTIHHNRVMFIRGEQTNQK
jgi:hypothetical protein